MIVIGSEAGDSHGWARHRDTRVKAHVKAHVKAKVIFCFGNRCVYLQPTNHVSMIRRVP
jgi:hypothetical protein